MVLITVAVVKMSKESKKITYLLKNPNKFFFLKDKIKNKINFKDNLIDVRINDILALKKNVRVYQWIEDKKLMSKTGAYVYTYRKEWSNNFIDSKEFHDKTKNNYQKNAKIYKSEILFPDSIITKKNNYELDQTYFKKKVEFKKFEFRDPKVVFYGVPLEKTYDIRYEEEETYKDLDSYVASEERKIAKNDTDKFRIIGKSTLFNGDNYREPEIGDVEITYEIFSPEYLSFFGKVGNNKLLPNEGFMEVDFNGLDKPKLIKKYKTIFLVKLAIFVLFTYLMLSCVVDLMQKKITDLVLKIIPYFNEYFVFADKNSIIILLFFMYMFFAIRLYLLIIIPMIILYFLRQIDYYSI